MTDALGYIGEQLEEHVSAAAQNASESVEGPLFDARNLKMSSDEKTIYDCLDKEPLHIEQIIADAELAAGSVNAALISLRLKGLIRQLPGSMFVKR